MQHAAKKNLYTDLIERGLGCKLSKASLLVSCTLGCMGMLLADQPNTVQLPDKTCPKGKR
eukprot:1152646-Pelagomonas_calceolata.AAC.9